jgi:hypothetical protein
MLLCRMGSVELQQARFPNHLLCGPILDWLSRSARRLMSVRGNDSYHAALRRLLIGLCVWVVGFPVKPVVW